jgi:hypothetical protein
VFPHPAWGTGNVSLSFSPPHPVALTLETTQFLSVESVILS